MDFITEPATLVTDYLLAAFTAVLAWRLKDLGPPQRLWAAAMAAISIAGLAGGTVHGFVRVLPGWLTSALWISTLEMLVLGALAVALATIRSVTVPSRARNTAAIAISVSFLAYAAWVPARPVFAAAIAAYGAALLLLGSVEAWQFLRARASSSSAWFLAGVLLSLLGAAVQQSGWAPHRHFNHNDLYHVIQAGAVWLLYRGARLIRDVPPT